MAVEYPFALAVIFLCLSVVLLAQAAITIYTYNKEGKAKDLNFWWSVAVCVAAGLGTLASLGAMFMHRKSAQAVASNISKVVRGKPTAAQLQAQAEAAAELEEATARLAKLSAANVTAAA
jgi:hypothetical protein